MFVPSELDEELSDEDEDDEAACVLLCGVGWKLFKKLLRR